MRKKMIYISMLMFMFTLFIACTREKPKVEAEIYSVTESDAAIMDLSDDVKINSTEDTVTTIENSDNEKEETDINEENSKPSKSTQGDNKTENKSETITGTIESIGDGKTVINKAITSDDVMVSSISNKQLVSIFLNQCHLDKHFVC